MEKICSEILKENDTSVLKENVRYEYQLVGLLENVPGMIKLELDRSILFLFVQVSSAAVNQVVEKCKGTPDSFSLKL
jgi:hypothetical protein